MYKNEPKIIESILAQGLSRRSFLKFCAITASMLAIPVAGRSLFTKSLARNLETKFFCDALYAWYDRLISNIESGDIDTFNDDFWDPTSWPYEAQGVGLVEAPRGALAHYVTIENGKIGHYQAVVPTTWNGSPRDANGQGGAIEQALLEHKIYDWEQPLELLRTIHTFDPCLACAVHLAGQDW